MKLKLKAATTSKKLRIYIQDSSSTSGAALTGLTNASSGLTWYYFRDGDTSATSVSIVSASLGTFTSGGFKEVDATNMPGVYEIGVPNAVLSVAGSAQMILKGATNMLPVAVEFELDAVDYQDSAAFGLSRLDAAVSSRASATDYTTARAAKLDNLDAAISTRSTYAGGAVASVTAAVTVGTNNDKTGYSLSQSFPSNFASLAITAGGAVTAGTVSDKTGYTVSTVSDKTGYALTSAYDPAKTAAQAGDAMALTSGERTTLTGVIWAALTSGLTTVGSIGKWILDKLDAAVSSRSTYDGSDTSGTTTLLGRLTGTRAGLLDNLDAAISTRSTYAGADTAGTTTLLGRLTSGRAGNLDNLDAAISSRSTYAGADTAGTTTLLSRLTGTRAGYLDNLSAGVSSLTSSDIVTALGTYGAATADDLTGGVTVTVDADALADGILDHADAVDGLTIRKLYRGMGAVLLGKSTNGGSQYYSLDGDKVRVTATMDSRGNRTSVMEDLT